MSLRLQAHRDLSPLPESRKPWHGKAVVRLVCQQLVRRLTNMQQGEEKKTETQAPTHEESRLSTRQLTLKQMTCLHP